MREWGFTYSTVGFVWHKITKDGASRIAKGYTTRTSTEPCLFGRRGAMPKVHDRGIDQFLEAEPREHSRKPAAFRSLLRDLFGDDVLRLEMFARETAPGWDAYGDQIGLFDEAAE